MTATPTETLTDDNPVIETDKRPVFTDDGDHERFSHYVRKEALEKAIFDGIPTRALCGKLWLPTKDPSRFPVCPECKEVWESLSG